MNLRPPFQALFVDPLAKCVRIAPTAITLIGCLIGIAAAFFVGLGWKWTGFSLLFFSGYLDMLDGTVARRLGKTSSFGTVLDIVCDRIVEFAIILSFFHLYQAGYATLFMLGSTLICVTSFLVVSLFLDEKSEKGFCYSWGLIERGEAFVFFGAMILFPGSFLVLSTLYTLLVFATAAVRLLSFKHVG